MKAGGDARGGRRRGSVRTGGWVGPAPRAPARLRRAGPRHPARAHESEHRTSAHQRLRGHPRVAGDALLHQGAQRRQHGPAAVDQLALAEALQAKHLAAYGGSMGGKQVGAGGCWHGARRRHLRILRRSSGKAAVRRPAQQGDPCSPLPGNERARWVLAGWAWLAHAHVRAPHRTHTCRAAGSRSTPGQPRARRRPPRRRACSPARSGPAGPPAEQDAGGEPGWGMGERRGERAGGGAGTGGTSGV